MKNNPRRFSKKPIVVGIAAALSLSLFGASLNNAQAARWEFGDVEVSFDSTFSAGTSIRTENRNWDDNVAKANNLNNDFDFSQYSPFANANPTKYTIWQGAGGFSSNGDNGNLNYDAGESFSQLIKGSHELNVQYDNLGVFVRGMYYYDFAMMDSSRDWTNPVSGMENNPCDDSEAKKQVCADVRLLDAYFYGDFDLGEMPLSVRVGQQVISWGESTLIGHGISEINPVDLSRLKAPGSELTEAFILFGAVWGALGVTENFSIEAFYQLEYKETVIDACGSYFSQADYLAEGCDKLVIQPGPTTYQLAEDPELHSRGFYAERGTDENASDSGQFGIAFKYYAEELNATEFGLYYMNYHSRLPYASAEAGLFNDAKASKAFQSLRFIIPVKVTRLSSVMVISNGKLLVTPFMVTEAT